MFCEVFDGEEEEKKRQVIESFSCLFNLFSPSMSGIVNKCNTLKKKYPYSDERERKILLMMFVVVPLLIIEENVNGKENRNLV